MPIKDRIRSPCPAAVSILRQKFQWNWSVGNQKSAHGASQNHLARSGAHRFAVVTTGTSLAAFQGALLVRVITGRNKQMFLPFSPSAIGRNQFR